MNTTRWDETRLNTLGHIERLAATWGGPHAQALAFARAEEHGVFCVGGPAHGIQLRLKPEFLGKDYYFPLTPELSLISSYSAGEGARPFKLSYVTYRCVAVGGYYFYVWEGE
jgi:hypothetical protein